MPQAARNHQTYTVMMQGLVRVGRSEEALALLNEAAAQGLAPNDHMFRSKPPPACPSVQERVRCLRFGPESLMAAVSCRAGAELQ